MINKKLKNKKKLPLLNDAIKNRSRANSPDRNEKPQPQAGLVMYSGTNVEYCCNARLLLKKKKVLAK